MPYTEPRPPKSLKEIQEWFASIITQPIGSNNHIAARTPRGKLIAAEAQVHILPNASLQSFERIEIYNQQYWWRLLNTLHEAFPLLLRLFGFTDFNKTIGIPFLKKYPPNYWTLNVLGDRLPKWVKERYNAEDRELVLNAALIDSAFNFAFFAKQMPPLSIQNIQGENATTAMQTKLYLQPHAQLFKMPYDLFAFRTIFIKESPEHWVDNDFPELESKKEYCFLLYRKPNNYVSWREITSLEHAILRKFSLGETIEKICTWVEAQDTAFQEEAESKLSSWFQYWTAENLLTEHLYQKS